MHNIKIENVTKKIKGSTVLDQLSLYFEGGQTYGLTGINGSGKTMVLRLIAGLIKADIGEVFISDRQVKLGRVQANIGALIENPNFINEFNGWQNLNLLSFLDSKPARIQAEINLVLEKVGLEPNDKRLFQKYSLGMKQKLGIAQAIIGDPDVILLDEPTNALDTTGVDNLKTIVNDIQKKKKTLIIASHDKQFLHEVMPISHIVQLENGRLMKS